MASSLLEMVVCSDCLLSSMFVRSLSTCFSGSEATKFALLFDGTGISVSGFLCCDEAFMSLILMFDGLLCYW